jgi:hypothetical protein
VQLLCEVIAKKDVCVCVYNPHVCGCIGNWSGVPLNLVSGRLRIIGDRCGTVIKVL